MDDSNIPGVLPAVPGSRLNRRRPRPLALEQRFVFDGAAGAEAVEALAEVAPAPVEAAVLEGPAPPESATPNELALDGPWPVAEVCAPVNLRLAGDEAGAVDAATQGAIAAALEAANRRLEQLAGEGSTLLTEVFGQAGSDPQAFAERLVTILDQLGTTGLAIQVELVRSDVLQGGLAGYTADSGEGERIYLNADWAAQADVTAIASTLLEEFGHALDQRLNAGLDSPGDEGALFALLLGSADTVSDAQRAVLEGEDDHAWLTIGERAVWVERAAAAEVSVPFYEGFIGTIGNNPGQANTITNFSTLGIARVSFFQLSTTGSFGGTQGNDLSGGLRLTTTSGAVYEVMGAINWRITQNGDLRVFGFIPDPGMTPLAITYSGGTYTISGTSNFGLERVGVVFSAADGANVSGNAALSGLLTEMNNYLSEVRANAPAGPVTVNPLTTTDTTPTLTGTASVAAGQSLIVIVNGRSYNTGNGLQLSGSTWSLTIPDGQALALGTYDVTATITDTTTGYTLTDSSSDELVIQQVVANRAPVAVNDSLAATEDTPKTYTAAQLLGNDTDADGNLLSIASVANGSGGTVVLNNDGTVTFTPSPNFNGTATFSYIASDGQATSNSATVTVTVAATNDAPVGGKLPDGTDDPDYNGTNGRYEITTPEDTPKSGSVRAFDVDGDTLGYTVDTQPIHGTLTLNSTTGAYTYTPAPDYHGSDSFVVEVSDGNGGTVLVTVDVTVTPDNDAPVGGKLPDGTDDPDYDATNGRYAITTPEDTPKSGSVRAFDVDGDTLGYTVDTQPTHGTVTLNSTTGAYTYTPAPDYHGPDSFVVEVSDGNGGTVLVTVDVTVTPDNDAPVGGKLPDGTDDPDYDGTNGRYEISTPEDTPKSGTVKAFDQDGDTLGYTVDTQPTHGTLTLDPATGAYTYTPAPDYHGSDSFVVEVSDGNGGTALVTVDVTVTPDNDAPVGGKLPDGTDDPDYDATNGRYAITTPQNTPQGGRVRGYDRDGDTLGYVVTSSPAHGTVSVAPLTGQYTFTPASGFVGTDSFVVTVSDGQGGTAQITVRVTVTPVVTPVPPVVPAPVVLPPPPPPAPAPVLVAPLPMAPVVLPEPPSAPVAPPVVPFDSVVRTPVTASPVSVAAPGLVALSSSPLNFAALADNRAAFSDLYTSRSGFPVVVFQLDRPSLTLYHGVSDQYADAGAVSSFTVPYDAFAHTDPSERITLSATQADGRPLPGWVRFDAESGRFDIETPRGVRGELAIKLSARDTQGREVSTLFRLSVGERQGNNGGRAGLGEQLRQAGQRTGAAVERAPAAASARAG